MIMKLSKLVTLTTGLSLGLGCLSNQEAIAGTLGGDFAGKSIEKISLIANEVSIEPKDSLTNYTLELQLKVSFLDAEEQPGEGTWFINRSGSFNTVGSLFTLRVDFCESSASSSLCHSLFDNFITINNNTPIGKQFSRTHNEVEDIVTLLTNDVDNNVRLEATLIGSPFNQSFTQSTSESIFFVSTPPVEPATIPEPLTILGSATAIGFGAFFKRKLGQKKS